jgi:hypothetical protein
VSACTKNYVLDGSLVGNAMEGSHVSKVERLIEYLARMLNFRVTAFEHRVVHPFRQVPLQAEDIG